MSTTHWRTRGICQLWLSGAVTGLGLAVLALNGPLVAVPDGSKHWSNVMHVLSWFPHWHGGGQGSWVLDGDFGTRLEPDGIHETPPTGNWSPTHWMPLPGPPVLRQVARDLRTE